MNFLPAQRMIRPASPRAKRSATRSSPSLPSAPASLSTPSPSPVSAVPTSAPEPEPGPVDPLDEVEQGVIALFADLSAALGLPRSFGQIYGLAYASVEPICFDAVVSRLGLSKGSASQGLRVLRELGALRPAQEGAAKGEGESGRASEKATSNSAFTASPLPGLHGPRREYFVPETSVRALLGAIIRQRVQPPLASGGERLAQLKARLPAVAPASRGKGKAARGKPLSTDPRATHLAQRLHSLEGWHKKARAFLPFLLKLAG